MPEGHLKGELEKISNISDTDNDNGTVLLNDASIIFFASDYNNHTLSSRRKE